MIPELERVKVARQNLNIAAYAIDQTRDPARMEEVTAEYVSAEQEHTLALRNARKVLKVLKEGVGA